MLITCGNLLQARVLIEKKFFTGIWKCNKGEYICLCSQKHYLTF